MWGGVWVGGDRGTRREEEKHGGVEGEGLEGGGMDAGEGDVSL